MSYRLSEDVPDRNREDVVKTFSYRSISKAKKLQEIRRSVFGVSINKCYITKMAPTAQEVDNTKRRDMNYVS